jgi:hypothetical protein
MPKARVWESSTPCLLLFSRVDCSAIQGSGIDTSSTAVGALAQSLSCRRPLLGRATGIFYSCRSRRTTPFQSSSAASPRSGKPFSSWPLRQKSVQFKSKSMTARLMPSFFTRSLPRTEHWTLDISIHDCALDAEFLYPWGNEGSKDMGERRGAGAVFFGGGQNLTERLFRRFCSCRQTPSLPCTSFQRLREATRVARAPGQIPDEGHCLCSFGSSLCGSMRFCRCVSLQMDRVEDVRGGLYDGENVEELIFLCIHLLPPEP